MDVTSALRRLNGVARMRDLRQFGIDRELVWSAIREQRVVRIRNGWIALPTTSPIEFAAVEARGLLTCASAATVRGFPAEGAHFHIRSRVQSRGVLRTTRRATPSRHGSCVGIVEMIVDYLDCQKPEWSVALVDYLERMNKLTADEWCQVSEAVTRSQRELLTMRSALPESALESVVRFKLSESRIPHTMQVEIGRFRVDFVISKGLILETHGAEFHADRGDWERDRRRVAWLRAQGWEVLEISFSQVTNEWESVLAAIQAARSGKRNRQRIDF